MSENIKRIGLCVVSIAAPIVSSNRFDFVLIDPQRQVFESNKRNIGSYSKEIAPNFFSKDYVYKMRFGNEEYLGLGREGSA